MHASTALSLARKQRSSWLFALLRCRRKGQRALRLACWCERKSDGLYVDDEERLLRLPEVAELLGLSVWMVRRLIRRRELVAINISTGPGRPTWRVERRAVRAYVAARRRAAYDKRV